VDSAGKDSERVPGLQKPQLEQESQMITKQGDQLEVGDVVHIYVNDVMSGTVARIEEGGLADAKGNVSEAVLVISIPVPIRMTPGSAAPVYLIHKPKHAPEGKGRIH
jgi:ribosomal protein L21E